MRADQHRSHGPDLIARYVVGIYRTCSIEVVKTIQTISSRTDIHPQLAPPVTCV